MRCVSGSASLRYDSLSLDEGVTRVCEESAYTLRRMWVRLDALRRRWVGLVCKIVYDLCIEEDLFAVLNAG